MSSQRQARRERNREDFLRATQQSLGPSHDKALAKLGITDQVGANAGNTFQENLEDEIRKAVRVHARLVKECQELADKADADAWGEQGVEHRRKAARGVIRGLCKALLIYEDSYNMHDKYALAKIEKEFLTEGQN